MTRDLLLIGAGYLSAFVAEQADADSTVLAVSRTRRVKPAGARATWRQLNVDVWSSAARDALETAGNDGPAMACVLLTPSGYPATGLGTAVERLAHALLARGVERLVLASSTGIYDGADPVDADTPVRPTSARARRLLDIENAWRAALPDCRILRLAGLYGPRRIIGLVDVESGASLPGTGKEWLNLLDARDAARGLLAALGLDAAPRPGPLSDGVPIERRRYYSALARLRDAPPPRFDPARQRRGTARPCTPDATWAALDCTPVHVDFEANLRALLDIGPNERP